MNTIVDIQGFKTAGDRFVAKEIAIQWDGQVLILLIKPPHLFYLLPRRMKQIVLWMQGNKEIIWNEGFVPQDNIGSYIEFLKHRTVYVKGRGQATWLRHYLDNGRDENNNLVRRPSNVHDLGLMKCPPQRVLRKMYRSLPDIGRCHYHFWRCAYRNVYYLTKWCEDNKIFD